jgi:DNA-binding MarR family transcriptional regulator
MLSDADYQKLYSFRARLRRFLHESDERIRGAGLTPLQYVLLLGIRAAESPRGPTIGDIAEFLVLKHHSVVELIDRSQDAGLLRRQPDRDDGRVVRLTLMPLGSERLERVAAGNLQELARLELISSALDSTD